MLTLSTQIAAKLYSARFKLWERDTAELQCRQLLELLKKGCDTTFGSSQGLKKVKCHADFVEQVPIRAYEDFVPFISRVMNGERNVLWPGRPLYFAKTSGTTSGAKYIPITKDSLPNHIGSARLALLMYIYKTQRANFVNGKYIFISGSPELELKHGIPTGRLSGIVNHHVPWYVRMNQLPSYATNCIDDWERKLDAIVTETISKRMTLISGIPPWVEMYFDKMLKAAGKSTITEVFPHFSLFVYGGVNYKPYQQRMQQLIGREIDTLETYPASEGFFAFQDEFPSQGLLLIPDSGIFYEFVPADRFYDPNPPRLTLEHVELDTNYALIVSTNAGLWAYSTGDTVKFVSTNPFRIVVTGRITQYTSAFGEHVIAEEVEHSLASACKRFSASVSEFTVAPLVNNPQGLPCHEWFIEFYVEPTDLDAFRQHLDQQMQQHNPYYKDLIVGSILQPLTIHILPHGSFVGYMKSVGKLGGQNKVPRLKNDRSIADALLQLL